MRIREGLAVSASTRVGTAQTRGSGDGGGDGGDGGGILTGLNKDTMDILNTVMSKSNVEPLSTENFTVDTTENDMTVHQRKKAATVLDTAPPAPPAPPEPVLAWADPPPPAYVTEDPLIEDANPPPPAADDP